MGKLLNSNAYKLSFAALNFQQLELWRTSIPLKIIQKPVSEVWILGNYEDQVNANNAYSISEIVW
jgi:hypothetical protein